MKTLNRNDRIVVVGSGTLASQCTKLLYTTLESGIYVYEKKLSGCSILEQHMSKIPNIHYAEIGSEIEKEIIQYDPKIIFSIGNAYIFPDTLTSRFPIINYHNALLPKHPGRNAEAWTIFSLDKVAGVTWHFVDAIVDTGDIILQREIPLSENMTSIRLLSAQTQVAYQMFEELLYLLCRKKEIPHIRQKKQKDIKFHFSWEKPNHGELDLSWDIPHMYAFLRAMDYGKLAMLGVPKLTYQGSSFTWQRYFLVHTAEKSGIQLDLSGRECRISRGGDTIRLTGLQICE